VIWSGMCYGVRRHVNDEALGRSNGEKFASGNAQFAAATHEL